jgi:hypothetical protein
MKRNNQTSSIRLLGSEPVSSDVSSLAESSKEKPMALTGPVFAFTGPLLKLKVTGLSDMGRAEGADGPALV